jgi:hypothetical protein
VPTTTSNRQGDPAMSNRFSFTTRDWLWFCLVFALAMGWVSTFRHNEWLDANTVVVPKGIGISKDGVADPLGHTMEALRTEREHSKELKQLMLDKMSKEQLKEVGRELAKSKKDGLRRFSTDIDLEFSWATQ